MKMIGSNDRTLGEFTEVGKGMCEGLKKYDKGVQTSITFSASKLRRLRATHVRERLWEFARPTCQEKVLVSVTGAKARYQ